MPPKSSASVPAPHHVPLIINGVKQSSSSGETYETYGYDGNLISTVESALWEDIDKAIETASAAQPAWENTPVSDRRDVLLKAADLILDQSKPYFEGFAEAIKSSLGDKADWQLQVYAGSAMFKGFAAMSSRLTGETFPSRLPGGVVISQRRAYGVLFLMVPWNGPIALALRVMPLALLCGNTIVFRSTELCPRAHELLTDLLLEAGLPKGVLNLIHITPENNPTFLPKIIAHPKINLISFTGSTAVGRILAAEAGKNLKEILLELGGKAAAVVLEDADIEQAARAIVTGAYDNAGQICMCTTRVIVQRTVADKLISHLKSLTEKLRAGPAGQNANIMGVRNAIYAERIVAAIREARDKGAEVLVGDAEHDGSFLHPHLLLGHTPDMTVWKDELFGPVLVVTICDTVDEAIGLANDTEYSLTNCLWTTNLKALEWASRMRAGMNMINGSSWHFEVGIGSTGLGGRSGFSTGNIESYTQIRTTVVFNDKVPNLLLDNLGL